VERYRDPQTLAAEVSRGSSLAFMHIQQTFSRCIFAAKRLPHNALGASGKYACMHGKLGSQNLLSRP
jgi:hypothetical protein